MCTISVFPRLESGKSFILTFNRDEATDRKTFPPKLDKVNECEMIYPKDAVAGGTWLGVSDQKRLVGIMNGEYKAHKRNPPYRKSRGVVVKEFLAAIDLEDYAKKYNFEGIEPFTMITIEWGNKLKMLEMVWDASKLHRKNLDLKPQIWSSSPLYDPEIKKLRMNWFQDFRNRNKITANAIWEFHHKAGIGDKNIDLIVDRGFLKTQSISQIHINAEEKQFLYEELSSGKRTNIDLSKLV